MGSRGPQPTPTAILRLRGSWRADQNRGEPQPPPGPPTCPEWLTAEAKEAWDALVPVLDAMGCLTMADANALSRYCLLWARWRKAEDFIEKHGDSYPTKHRGELILKTFPQVRNADRLATQLSRLEAAFGLTPAARSRISSREVEEAPAGNDKGRFFSRA